MVVLEREDRARARGAHIYATVEGYGSTCDAYHRVQMDPTGIRSCARCNWPSTRSGRELEEIGYVNFHGTSTVLNDAVEARCVRRLFGPMADRVPGSSTKSMIGHPQGASGAAGIVTTALALERRVPAAHDQSGRSRPRLRHRRHSQHRPSGVAGGRAVQLPRIRIEEQRDRPGPGMNRVARDQPAPAVLLGLTASFETIAPSLALAALAFVPMIGEALHSARNERRLRQQGAVEPADDVFAAMQLIYPSCFAAMIVEHWVRQPQADAVTVAGAMVFGAAQSPEVPGRSHRSARAGRSASSCRPDPIS